MTLLRVDEQRDVVASCVLNGAALILLVALSRPACAFPAAEVLDLLVGQVQLVKGGEESCMMREAAQTHAMRAVAVVETRVFRFDSDEIAVEKTNLYTHFLYKVQGEMSSERRRIIVPRPREQMSVQQMGDGSLAAHLSRL